MYIKNLIRHMMFCPFLCLHCEVPSFPFCRWCCELVAIHTSSLRCFHYSHNVGCCCNWGLQENQTAVLWLQTCLCYKVISLLGDLGVLSLDANYRWNKVILSCKKYIYYIIIMLFLWKFNLIWLIIISTGCCSICKTIVTQKLAINIY